MSERAIGNELLDVFMDAVKAERVRAHGKHGATSMEQAPPLDPWRGLILGEEALECGKALNDDRHGEITLYRAEQIPGGLNPIGDPLDRELIQTAAMAFTWWANRRGDRLPAIEPEPVPLCTICGLPKSPVHSKTRSGGYLTGHLFSPPSTPVDKPVDDAEIHRAVDLTGFVTGHKHWSTNPEEDPDAQAADTAQAPGSPGARGQQQGPEQEVQRGPGGQAPYLEPAPGAPEPEAVEGAPGWLVVTYRHQCPPECPDVGRVVTEKHWLGRLMHVIPPTCPATGVALVEVSRGHQAPRLAGASHIDSRFRRVQ